MNEFTRFSTDGYLAEHRRLLLIVSGNWTPADIAEEVRQQSKRENALCDQVGADLKAGRELPGKQLFGLQPYN